MTIGQFLQNATGALKAAEVESARLDCLVLLEDMLDKDRANLLAHPEAPLSEAQLQQLNKYVTQRQQHVPLAYTRGRADFCGRTFAVNNTVLIPRPETEAIVDLLLKATLHVHPRIADIGTGSGCIGITAALELPQSTVFLYDVAPDTLAVAKQNARNHKVRVHIQQQDLLKNCAEQFNAILANLPYVPNGHPINPDAEHEPKLALYSGNDGLDHYRLLWVQIATLNPKPGHVILEAMPEQHPALISLAQAAGYALAATQNFAIAFAAA